MSILKKYFKFLKKQEIAGEHFKDKINQLYKNYSGTARSSCRY